MPDLLQLFLIGIVSSYSACFISCWPIALPYVTATEDTLRLRLRAAIAFLSAKLLVYVVYGFTAALLGRLMTGWLTQHAPTIFIISGVAIMILGVKAALSGSHPCNVILKRLKMNNKTVSAALLGIFAGIIPCTTSAAVLAYIAFSAETSLMGAALGLAFGFGKFFSPLIPASILATYFQQRFKTIAPWLRYIASGLVILLGLRLILEGVRFFANS